MATINLGAIKFNWKGAYNNGTAYAVDDVVSSGGSSYVCILASTGNATSNGTYWEQMSSAGTNGTNGTDLTSTLTTQGDILYRDGSGLQRLAKGTASQELRMNSGATAPEWHTPAVATSDYVRLTTTTITSNTNNISFANVFTSSYDVYKLVINGMRPSGNASIRLRYFTSGTTEDSDATYNQGMSGNYLRHSVNTNTNALDHQKDATSHQLTTWGSVSSSSSVGGFHTEITFFNPKASAFTLMKNNLCYVYSDNDYSIGDNSHHLKRATTAYTGFKIYPSANNIEAATISLYGIKQ